jgi:glyoxylase-like metal-dependent hydrolase (beta-lactamase superfamily II)
VGPYLLAGDTLFPGGPGRTATSQDFEQIIGSIRTRILPLAEETRVYPGHGASTSVREARQEFALFSSHPRPAGLFGDVEWRTVK